MQDRNAESHFGHIETTNIKRSIFHMLFRNLSTCNAGDIIPFFTYSDVLPGDTIKINTNAVVRMQTPLNPTMDDAFVDTYYFAIPHRLVWEHWKEFMGENKDSEWVSQTEYTIPQMKIQTAVVTGTILDYMGIPKKAPGLQFSALPLRAYILTYNTWFRNQNLIAPLTEYTDDTTRQVLSTNSVLGGYPCKASKIPDYFTTCLPDAQKGTATPIPLGTSAPVAVFGNGTLGLYDGTNTEYLFKGTTGTGNYRTLMVSTTSGNPGASSGQTLQNGTANVFEGVSTDPTKSGLIGTADLTQATAATINALRLYFQVQKLKELGARGGTRYFEVIKNEFGTSPSMSALQYPEYLGGKRTPLNVTQIVQESSTVSNSQSLGTTGGMSHTVFSNDDFTKSFQEHTIILGLMVIRQYHTYQQGLHRMWSRTQKLDFYTPILAHLGEQPVYKKEIYAKGTASGSQDDQVFGYQERWAEYKYGMQVITGQMNSEYTNSLDVWHYGDKYASIPTLAQNWIEETPEYIDRTIAVTSSTAHQFKFDIVSNVTAIRPMPVYCTPGLIDHF